MMRIPGAVQGRRRRDAAGPAVPARTPQPLPPVHQRIVVGVDGSPASDDAPRWAARQADLTDGHPAEVLLAAAHGADLLVVGSCALAGRLLGSVSELVARAFLGECRPTQWQVQNAGSRRPGRAAVGVDLAQFDFDLRADMIHRSTRRRCAASSGRHRMRLARRRGREV